MVMQSQDSNPTDRKLLTWTVLLPLEVFVMYLPPLCAPTASRMDDYPPYERTSRLPTGRSSTSITA